MKIIKQILTQYNTELLIQNSDLFILITRLTNKDFNLPTFFINRSYLKRTKNLNELIRFSPTFYKFTGIQSFYSFFEKKNNWHNLSTVLAFNFYEWIVFSSTKNILFFNFFKIYKQIFQFLNFSWSSACLIKSLKICLN